MKKVLFSWLTLFLLVFTSTAQVFTEQFDYTPGTTLDSLGWNQHSGSSGPISIDATSLTFPQYSPNAVGGSAVSAGTSQDVNYNFGEITSGSVYTSFLLKIDTINNDGYFFHYMEDVLPSFKFRARTFFQPDANNTNAFNLGLAFNSGSGTYNTTEFTYGDVLLVVAKYTIVPGLDNDSVSLYVFDSNGSFTTEPTTPFLGPLGGTAGDIDPARIALRQFSGNAGYTIDAFSVDTMWNMMPFTGGSTPVASPYCNTQVFHFQNPVEVASSVFLTIQNTSSNSMEVIVESATSEPVVNLIIAGAAGAATISPIDTPATGQLRRTLSWAGVAPDTADFNVQWSKPSLAPGLWQLEPGASQLAWPVASICSGSGVKAQIDLPITWDDSSNVDYTVTDFGGATSSMLAADPSNPSNTVLMTTKGTAGQPWSGTTLSTANGLANPIPFAANQTIIQALVYSPDTGITVRLKIEDASNSNIFVEVDAQTTVANGWDTLSFNFSAVNLSNTYDKVTIFYDFNNLPSTATNYYVDDVYLVIPPPPSTSPYCNTQVFHFQNPAEVASSIYLTISSIHPDSIEVIIESANSDPVDLLSIAGAAGGATISPVDTPALGQLRLTLSWTTAPATASFNIIWSKVSSPGNWQLEPGAGQLNWTVSAQCTGGPPPPVKTQIDLPITWDDSTNVDYTVTDFGGATSSMLAADPSDPTNTVLMTTKGTAGQTWSGTTLSTPNGLANPIPFAAGSTVLKALVYAPDTGITVRMKIENTANSGIFIEVDAQTTVANAWDTLTFDFASGWNASNTYDKVSLFYNFNVLPTTAETWYVDDVFFVAPVSGLVSPYCNTQAFHLGNPTQTASEVNVTIQNAGPSAMEVIVASATADRVNNIVIPGGSGGVAGALDSSVTGQLSVMLTWTGTPPDTVSMNVLWGKVNNPGLWQLNASGNFDIPFNATCGTPPPPMKAQIDLPITWNDTANVDYTVTDFGGATASMLAADPNNASNLVLMTVKNTTGQPWSGTTLSTANGLANAIPFASGQTVMKALVFAPDTGLTVRMKVEDATSSSIFIEVDAQTTVANAWDTLTFDFASGWNSSNTYDKVSLFYDFNVLPSSAKTWYLDDVFFDPNSGGPLKAQIDLPITWNDTANVDYTVTDFGGASSMLAADPTNPSNLVLSSLKDTAAGVQPWAGTTLSTGNGLANEIPFTSTATTVSVALYAPDANVTIRLKAEDKSDATKFVEAEALTAVANAWDTLVFNFANNVTAPVLDTTQTYDLLSIFYNFNIASTTPKTYYIDDVFFGGTSSGPVLSQIDLPITWDDSTVNYVVTDFGGNASARIADPMNPSNMILRSIKTSGSQTFAGTTLSTSTGLANAIPFTANATTISCAIYSPKAGIPVVLKAENTANTGIFVQTGLITTVANAWDTLVFDFDNPLGGLLNPADTYDKLSIFYNFNTVGVGDTFYLDDVFFGGTATGVGPTEITFQVDMNNYAGSFTQPEINGTFNGFCGTCNPLTDANNDGIWETTITLLAAEIEYLFTHDNFTGIESFAPGAACTKTTIAPPDTFVNRFLVLTADTVLPPVCWESCSPYTGPVANADVTFQVDLSQYTGSYSQVNLNGTFNNWCGSCAVMTDANNDSIYEITVTVPTDTIEYLFTLDGFTVKEALTPFDSCTITTISTPDTFVNRYFVPMVDTTLPAVCWESCSACSGIGIDENGWANGLKITPNPSNGLFTISGTRYSGSQIEINVNDIQGKRIYHFSENTSSLDHRIDLSNMPNGMYLVNVITDEGIWSEKIVLHK